MAPKDPWDDFAPATDETDFLNDADYAPEKDALILIIESTPSFYAPGPSPTQPHALMLLLAQIHAALFKRTLYDKSSLAAVVLFNTNAPSPTVLIDLAVPSIADLQTFNLLATSRAHFEQSFAPAPPQASSSNSLLAALDAAASMLASKKLASYSSRRILLFTDRDSPLHAPQIKLAAKTRLRDLAAAGAAFIPCFIHPRPESPFDTRLFYEDILLAAASSDQDSPLPAAPCSLAEARLAPALLALQSPPKRSLFHLPLHLSPSLSFGLQAYALISPQSVPRPVDVLAVTDKTTHTIERIPANRKRIAISTETGKTLAPENVVRAYKFSDVFVPFTRDQMAAMRNFGPPQLRLLGFKDAAAAGWEYSLEKSYFLYPSESHYGGSKRTYAALHRSLTQKKKVALVWAILRANAPPRIAVIVPHGPTVSSTSSDDSKQAAMHPSFPTGLHLVPLAYADDLRHLPPSITNPPSRPAPPSAHLVASAKTVIQALRMSIGYSPRRYPNPHLARFYHTLQQAVFEQERDPALSPDQSLPKYNSIYKRARSPILAWTAELRQLEYQPAQASTYASRVTAKRAHDGGGGGDTAPAPKRAAPRNDYRATDDTSALARGGRRPRNAGATTETAALGRAQQHVLFERLRHQVRAYPLGARFEDVTAAQLREFADEAGIATRASTKAGLRSAVSRYFDEHFGTGA